MDSRTLDDHAWEALLAGVAPSTAPGAADAARHPDHREQGVDADARPGFQVLSLEQYAAGHVRSVHRAHEQHQHQR